MNNAPTHRALAALLQAFGSPEQRLTASRLLMAQALRQSVGVLLLQRVLGPVGSPCGHTPQTDAMSASGSASDSKPAGASPAPTAAAIQATHSAAAQAPGMREQRYPPDDSG